MQLAQSFQLVIPGQGLKQSYWESLAHFEKLDINTLKLKCPWETLSMLLDAHSSNYHKCSMTHQQNCLAQLILKSSQLNTTYVWLF